MVYAKKTLDGIMMFIEKISNLWGNKYYPWRVALYCYLALIFLNFFFLLAGHSYSAVFSVLEALAFFMLGAMLLWLWLERREIAKLDIRYRLLWRTMTVFIVCMITVAASYSKNYPSFAVFGRGVVNKIVATTATTPPSTPPSKPASAAASTPAASAATSTPASAAASTPAAAATSTPASAAASTPASAAASTPAFASAPAGGTPAANGSEKSPEESLIKYIGWFLSAIGIIIGFVVTLLYSIARDAKEQVDIVKETLGLDEKIVESKIALQKMDLLMASFALAGEISNDAQDDRALSAMKQTLTAIPAFCIAMQKLQEKVVDFAAALHQLELNYARLNRALGVINDVRFVKFTHEKLIPYLESVHAQLSKSEMAHHSRGQACISELAKIWNLARNYYG